jgi:hypothetical protein
MAGLRVSRLPIGGCVHSGRLGVIVAVSETSVTCPLDLPPFFAHEIIRHFPGLQTESGGANKAELSQPHSSL